MLRWMCHIKPGGNISTEDLRHWACLISPGRLEIGVCDGSATYIRSSNATKRILDLQVAARRKRGRPRMSWRELVDGDLRDWGLSPRDALYKAFWKRMLASQM